MSKYFTQLDYFTADYIEGLMRELDKMIGDEEIGFHREHRQICINTHKDFKDPRFKGTRDYMIGTGSLVYDWSDKYKYRKQQIKLPKEYQENQRLEEKDFNIVSPTFKGTVFEDLYNRLKEKHSIGRLRIMKMSPRNCLSWHKDTSPRMHIVLDTCEGNFMVIEDQVKHMPQNTVWLTDTRYRHTAFNSGLKDRIHIVGVLLDEQI
tara:strand:+ start:169 stop:786 length:618 start_codon:yes stop_codon:yes gene_type:complete